MKTIRAGWLALVLLALATRNVSGQGAGAPADTIYVGGEHSAVVSGIVEWILPTAGFAYAGDWKRGLLPNALRIASVVAFTTSYDDRTDQCDGACTAWAFAALGTTIWAIVGAVDTAHDYNARLHAREGRAAMSLEPSPWGGLALGVRMRAR